MSAYFSIGKCQINSEYVPRLGEVIQYSTGKDEWHIRIGDGKTPAKDLPSYYDLYNRLAKIEQEIQSLKNL